MLWQLLFRKNKVIFSFTRGNVFKQMSVAEEIKRRLSELISSQERDFHTRAHICTCVRVLVLFCTNASKQKRIGQMEW